MDFIHVQLTAAADSEQVRLLEMAAGPAGSTINPVAELYRLDCWPDQVLTYGRLLDDAAAQLKAAQEDIEKARKKMRGWKGDAGDGFRRRCDELKWACEKAWNRTRTQGLEARDIADAIDGYATTEAVEGQALAALVEQDCRLIIGAGGEDIPEEELEQAKARVRETLETLRTRVSLQVNKIPALTRKLDNLHIPRH